MVQQTLHRSSVTEDKEEENMQHHHRENLKLTARVFLQNTEMRTLSVQCNGFFFLPTSKNLHLVSGPETSLIGITSVITRCKFQQWNVHKCYLPAH